MDAQWLPVDSGLFFGDPDLWFGSVDDDWVSHLNRVLDPDGETCATTGVDDWPAAWAVSRDAVVRGAWASGMVVTLPEAFYWTASGPPGPGEQATTFRARVGGSRTALFLAGRFFGSPGHFEWLHEGPAEVALHVIASAPVTGIGLFGGPGQPALRLEVTPIDAGDGFAVHRARGPEPIEPEVGRECFARVRQGRFGALLMAPRAGFDGMATLHGVPDELCVKGQLIRVRVTRHGPFGWEAEFVSSV